ncbi:uncharacterized protein [Montipora foliosa]|uniref:uncharacterized protein n=1 Tax=Montipora foliosa TaxID=591990 RepID=UPI0035F17859
MASRGLGEESVELLSDSDEEGNVEYLPNPGEFFALVAANSTGSAPEVFVAKVVRLSEDRKFAILAEFSELRPGRYKLSAGRSYRERVNALVYPIDIVYLHSEGEYELRTSKIDIHQAEGVVIITEQSLQIQTSHENITTSALLNEQNHEISVPSHEQNKENTEALNPKNIQTSAPLNEQNHEISVPSHEQNKENTEALNPKNHEISVPSHEQNKEKTEALNPNNKDGRPPKRKNHEPLDGGGELPQRRCWRCQGIGHLQWECPSSRRALWESIDVKFF